LFEARFRFGFEFDDHGVSVKGEPLRGKRKAPASEGGRYKCEEDGKRGHLKVAATVELLALALAEGFVEENGGGSGCVEGFDVALHGDLDAGVGGVDDVFGEAGSFVADEEGDGLAPVEFPGGGGSVGGIVFVDAGGDGGDAVEFELGEEDAERGSGYEREVESGAGGGAESFGRKGAGGAGLAGGGGDGSGGAECGGGAEDGADVAGVLYSGENND